MNLKYIRYALLLITIPRHFLTFGMEKHLSKEIRNQLSHASIEQVEKLGDGNIIVKERLSKEKRYGQCHNYAWSKLMGIVGKVPKTFKNVQGFSDSYYVNNHINVLYHCNQVDQPQAGDVAIYLTDDKPLTSNEQILHTGLVTKNGNIESKWGTTRAVFEHPVSYVPNSYGNNILYFRANKTGIDLLNAVQKRLEDPFLKKQYKKQAQRDQQLLFDLARNDANSINLHNNLYGPANTSSWITLISRIFNRNIYANHLDILLQEHMNVHPNKPDKKGRTALMFAAHVGDKPSVNLLLSDYKAKVDAQDKKGNTALTHAAINGNWSIEHMLIDHGADPTTKNKYGLNADDYSKINYINNLNWAEVHS